MTQDEMDAAVSVGEKLIKGLFPYDLAGDARPQDPTNRMEALCLTIAICSAAIIDAIKETNHG